MYRRLWPGARVTMYPVSPNDGPRRFERAPENHSTSNKVYFFIKKLSFSFIDIVDVEGIIFTEFSESGSLIISDNSVDVSFLL